ncbi:protein kinase domain-containing protein [Crateriforma conspicua]|uniref:protein kinase domain-containing protein n=1 Tax=Crateriforma conspicua TaxID=2527996 RepID=UPI00118BAF44|nr:protein kinase [Crateriforma conspicua]QDV62595.1 Serine/threonine-protein kinase PknB [Crateriforma conspicua]
MPELTTVPEQTTHPSPTDLHAFGLGQLPPDEATAIERHISECEPCCETIADLSSADTFIELLQSADQEPNAQTADHQSGTTNQSSAGVPEPLAQHPRYEIIDLIGKGGMGDVYKARHRKMERTVALKVINRGLVRKAEAVDRFHREVKAAAQLSHPNIVTAYDADHAGDFHFMVMEYVDGVDLSQTVKKRGALPVAEACDYIRQAAIGLQHAHECGMVHRDIKPHNMMVTADGTIKILDFGLASLAPEAIPASDTVAVRSDLTAAGALMGTPDFISPEQATDARSVDIRSDIYSLGATFYFLLSGRPLFADGSVMEKLKGHAQFEPEPLNSLRDDVPTDLAIIISKMIAKDPEERFQTPVEVADALSKFKVAVAGGAVSASTEVEKAKPAFAALTLRRVPTLIALAIATVLAFGLLSVKGCGDPAQETQNAYTDLSSYLQTGKKTKHNTYSVNALNVLTDSSEGRKLLAKIDADSEELSFANFEDAGAKHAIDWAAALIHDDRVTPRQRELTVTVQHESGSYGPVGSAPSQFHLESVRIAKGGGFSGPKLVIGFAASDRAKDRQVVQETFQLKPGKRYEVDVDLVDVIDGSIDWIDLWRNGKEKAPEVHSGDDQPATAAASPSKPELKVTSKTVNKGTAGLPSLYDWNFKGRDLGDLKVRLLLAQNGKIEVMQEFDFEEIPTEFANTVRLEVRNDATGADRKRRVNAILFVESPVPSRSATVNEDKGLSISVEAPFSNTTELADLEPIDPGQTQLLLALSYWKGDMTHDLSMESMTAATKDGNATFLFVTLDWSPANPDVTQLQGDWETSSVTESGEQLATENGFGGLLLQIKGNRFVIKERTPNGDISDVDTGRIEIGSTATPKTIDFIDRDQPNQRSLGIYELNDGVLRICLVEQGGTDSPAGERIADSKPVKRPTTFDSPGDSNVMFMEFRRKQPDENEQSTRDVFDTTYINKDTVGLLVAHPQRILTRKSKVKEGFDQMFARIAESEGLDIRNLRQVVAQLGPPPLSSRTIRNFFDEQIWTLILRFNDPVDVTSYIDNHASGYTQAEHKGETYYQHDGRMEMWFPDDRTLVCAAERRILSLIDEPEGKGLMAARLGRADAVDDLLLEFDVRSAGPLLLESLPAEAQDPEVYPVIEQASEQLRRITLTAKQTSDTPILARFQAIDAETARALHDQASVLLETAKRGWPKLRESIRERPDDENTKLASAFADEVDSLVPAIRLTVDEDQLLVRVDEEDGVDLVGLLVFFMLID